MTFSPATEISSASSSLPDRLYTRFAEVTLELFSKERSFPIVVPQGQDVGRTVGAFEALACTVQIGPRERWITITCPV